MWRDYGSRTPKPTAKRPNSGIRAPTPGGSFPGVGGAGHRVFLYGMTSVKALPESPFGVCRVVGTDAAPTAHLQLERSEVLASGFLLAGAGDGN